MMAAFPELGTLKHMKTEALSQPMPANPLARIGWLLTYVCVYLSFPTAFAWAAVVGLLAMLPISYRGLAKRMLGR